MHVVAHGLIGGEQTIVGIKPGGSRMVVAGAQVAVAADAVGLTPHDQHQFGVSLVAHHAVHDVRARFLQTRRKFDVRLLVKARAQFDDHRDVLAGMRGGHQRIDDV